MNEPDILCPSCNKGIFSFKSSMSERVNCTGCNDSFSIENGILKLLPEFPGDRNITHVFHDWQPFVDIYDSSLFCCLSKLQKGAGRYW